MPKPIWLLPLAIPALLMAAPPADDLGEQLLAATRKGDIAVVKQLLDKGADVNSKNRYGSTPLFFACDRGHFEIAKLLIDKGADMNVKDTFYNASALSWAMNKKHDDIVTLMIEKGVDATEPLRGSVQNGDKKMFQLILEKGKVTQTMLDEALLVAGPARREEMAKELEKRGAKKIEVAIDEGTAKLYEGKYQDGDMVFTFVVKDGKLAFSQQAGAATSLYFLGNDKFRFLQASLLFTFERDASGKVTAVRFANRGGDTTLKKVNN